MHEPVCVAKHSDHRAPTRLKNVLPPMRFPQASSCFLSQAASSDNDDAWQTKTNDNHCSRLLAPIFIIQPQVLLVHNGKLRWETRCDAMRWDEMMMSWVLVNWGRDSYMSALSYRVCCFCHVYLRHRFDSFYYKTGKERLGYRNGKHLQYISNRFIDNQWREMVSPIHQPPH